MGQVVLALCPFFATVENNLAPRRRAMKTFQKSLLVGVAIAITLVAGQAAADPYPTEVLKFQQLPLNNGILQTYPAPTPGGAPFPGHDETSTAYLQTGAAPIYAGTYMADDFADTFTTPVVHVRWWGSYL